MRQPARFRELSRAQGRFDHGVHGDVAGVAGLRLLGVGVHHLGQELLVERAPVHADAHGLGVGEGDLDDGAEVLVAVLGADVAGVDAVLGERGGAVGILGEQQVAVVVEIADDWDVDLAHDVRHGARGVFGVDGDAHQLGAGLVEGADLRRRRGGVGGIGVGHGLDDDGVGRAHLNAAHVHRHGAAADVGHVEEENLIA